MLLRRRGRIGYERRLGRELTVTGDLSSTTGWSGTGAWTISGGVASATATAVNTTLTNTGTVSPGRAYLVSFDLVSRSAAAVSVNLGATAGTAQSVVGAYREVLSPTTSGAITIVARLGSFTGSVDNVSVREIL